MEITVKGKPSDLAEFILKLSAIENVNVSIELLPTVGGGSLNCGQFPYVPQLATGGCGGGKKSSGGCVR